MITFLELGNFGRLGNQLFQIAAALSLAKENNDVALFPSWEYKRFFKNPINDGIQGIAFNDYNEPSFSYSKIPYQGNMNLRGYFQSEKYFLHCSDLIRHHFEFVDGLSPNIENMDCSIHVRRTDYLKLQDYHPFPGLNYYNRAIEMMKQNGCARFFVFSDDITWCKNNLPKECIFVEGQSNIQDLSMMSKCSNNIIANSSFSWWAAWLNKNQEKKVIAPARWFGPANQADTKDLYCDGWIKI